MEISLLRIIDNEPISLLVIFDGNPVRKFIQTNKGKMLKIQVKEPFKFLHNLFEVSCTEEYIYIPVKYIKEIK